MANLVGLSEEQVCNQIVAAADSLELGPLNTFATNSNPPKWHGKLLVPAIAIPAEPKSDFVCPTWQVDSIADALPRVAKVIVVGWKGAEESLQKMLLSLPASVRGLVVSGSESDGNDTIAKLKLPGSFHAATGGFTRSLYVTNEIQKFVES